MVNMSVQSWTGLSDAAAGDEGSFLHRARRAQLVEAAVRVIAARGLAGASTVVVAREAGVSRGVLTYHFRDRADLVAAVVEQVYGVARDQLAPRVTAAGDPAAALREFVLGSIAFYRAYPDHMAALSAVFAAGRQTGEHQRADVPDHHRELDEVTALLSAGRDRGVFRDFDVVLMAASIRALLDVALQALRRGEDPDHVGDQTVAAVTAMTAVRA